MDQNPLIDTPVGFDEQLYLALNPDVADAVARGTSPSGLAHWLASGREDELAGRRPSINQEQYYRSPKAAADADEESDEFDAAAYLDAYPDVRAATGGSLEAAREHWLKHGRIEGRLGRGRRNGGVRSINFGRLATRPFGVTFYGPLSAKSGLGTASRGYLAALRAAGVPTDLVNVDTNLGNLRVTAADRERAAQYRVNIIHINADVLERFAALFREGQFDHAYNIGIWAWELNVLRPDWYPAFAFLDEVWTPSSFNSAAVAAIAPVPVRTFNHVVPPPRPSRCDRAYFGLPSGFLFMTAFDVGSSMDRKNPSAAVAAFRRAFGSRDDVHLLLKFHSAHHNPKMVRTLLRETADIPNVIIRSDKMNAEEWAGLQGCIDCFVSPHRSEGFGLNIAEAMALEKPVIATGYSGNMDFTTPENSYLVPFRIQPVREASGPYLPNYLWAEPDVGTLAALMRRVVEDPVGRKRIGRAAAQTVQEHLSAEHIGGAMARRFEQLGLVRDLPAFAAIVGRSSTLEPPPATATMPLTDPARGQANPTISVIVPVYNIAPEYLIRCIESVRVQTWQRWELCLCNDASTDPGTLEVLRNYQGLDPRIRIKHLPANRGIATASNEAALLATGSYLLMLDNDDELAPDAIERIARAITADPNVDALYGDEDKIDESGELCDHYYKPDWSPEHLESVMYTLHPLTVRASLFLRLGGFREEFSGAQDWDLMLRVSRETDAIHHVPNILYHWRKLPGSASAKVDAKPQALDAGARALADHVAAKYGPENARVEPGEVLGFYRVRHRIRSNPAVTLLITTNNTKISLPGRNSFIMVDNLLDSIRDHTAYDNYAITVVDNGNSSERQLRERRRRGITTLSYGGSTSPFNYADKANFALRSLATEHVVLMNDDMEAFDADWLPALLEFSQYAEIGAVGGKLLHADGTIQHVGSVLGVCGGSAHVYHGFPGEFVGYNGFTHVVRNYSAMTGACLATRRSVLNEVGGFDPSLAIDYNDIDLCLRMRKHGYRIVYTPHSKLFHFEGKTERRTVQNTEEVALFRSRWAELVDNDPFYNPNLSRDRHDFQARSDARL